MDTDENADKREAEKQEAETEVNERKTTHSNVKKEHDVSNGDANDIKKSPAKPSETFHSFFGKGILFLTILLLSCEHPGIDLL